jgi:hypothetical protein
MLFFVLIVGLATGVYAQGTTGTIFGTVSDQSGGLVPGVTVIVTNIGTGLERSIPSSSNGTFLVPDLPPGQYRVNVTTAGFAPFVREQILLETGQNVRVDVPLQLATASQHIEVTSQSVYVDTLSSSVGHVVDDQRMQQLPLLDRSSLTLVELAPGVTNTTFKSIVTTTSAQPSVSAGGARQNQNSVTLDGAELSGGFLNRLQNLPSPDSVEEFQVLTSTYSAEYGRSTGAAVTAITKSGSNDLHGAAWEYFRNDGLNAKNYFASSRPLLQQNQFGGAIGGPLIHKRTFFFGSYEGIRINQEAILDFFVPTAAQRTGDFSASSKPIINPMTGQPFPGNHLTSLDPLAVNFANAYLPLPTNEATGEYHAFTSLPTHGNQLIARVDHRLSNSDTLFVRYYRNNTVARQGPVPALESDAAQLVQSTTGSNTTTFRSNLVGEGSMSYTTSQTTIASSPNNKTPQELGAQYAQDGPVPLAPGVAISGGVTALVIQPWNEPYNTLNYEYKVSWSTARHALKFGFQGFHQSSGSYIQYLTSGLFVFAGLFTGNPFADYMLGRPVSFQQLSRLNRVERQHTLSGFIEDDVKLGRRLTVNLGLRYEAYSPWAAGGGATASFRAGQQSTRYPNAPPGMVYCGDAGGPCSQFPFQNTFAPRVGFAWDVRGDGRTAVRVGYGIFYTPFQSNDALYTNNEPPFTQTLSFVPPSFSNPYAIRPSPFPYNPSPSGEAVFAYPFTVSSMDPNLREGYLHQYNVNVQHQLGRDLIVQVGYYGSLGRSLLEAREINAAVFGPGATAANAQLRRPIFPQYYAGISNETSHAESEFNSLQVIATKKYTHGYTAQVAYTLSKSMDDCSLSTPGCLQDPSLPISSSWARSDFDRRQVLRINGIWDVPRPSGSSILGLVLGGWRVAGILSALSGLPFSVTSGSDVALLGPSIVLAPQRMNVTGNPELSTSRSRSQQVAEYFNTAAFTLPAKGQFGNSSRNILTGPGAFTTDASLSKIFYPWSGEEQRRIEFRADAFNLFNRAQLGMPLAARTSPAFGAIKATAGTASDARVVQLALRFDF